MFPKAALLSAVLGAIAVSAQTPSFKSPLLLQPGNTAAKCLRADNSNGAHVVIADCTGNTDQTWTFANGQVSIYDGKKCLDVTDGKTNNGVKLQVWDCSSSNANQQFWYTGYGDNHLAWTNHGKCLDLTDGSLSNGNQVQLWDCSGPNPNQVWDTGYMYGQQPTKSENNQQGNNNCGTSSSQSSHCQTAWINDADDFCLWAPPDAGPSIGDSEQYEVAWCTKSGRGTRTIPDGTLKGVHFVRTPDYVQVTGVGDMTKINVKPGDAGGELDPHGPDGNGNPVGGLVYGNTFGGALQYHEWMSFIGADQFCFRACVGPNARENCQHIYDEMGCYWNMPANYNAGTYESCKGDDAQPPGVYGTSTWYQGQNPTPSAHPVPASSSCTPFASITASPAKRDISLEKMVRAPSPQITPAPEL